jgi:hypothetical protein
VVRKGEFDALAATEGERHVCGVQIDERGDPMRAVRRWLEGSEDPSGRVAMRPRLEHEVLRWAR